MVVVCTLAAGMYEWQAALSREGIRTETLGWMLAPDAGLSPDSRQIDVLFIQPGCGPQGKLYPTIEYRPTEVALGLRVDYDPTCLMSGGTVHLNVDLAEPLGNRLLVPLDQPNLTLDDFQPPPPPPTTDPAFGKDRRL